jgi:hypothetical protein
MSAVDQDARDAHLLATSLLRTMDLQDSDACPLCGGMQPPCAHVLAAHRIVKAALVAPVVAHQMTRTYDAAEIARAIRAVEAAINFYITSEFDDAMERLSLIADNIERGPREGASFAEHETSRL